MTAKSYKLVIFKLSFIPSVIALLCLVDNATHSNREKEILPSDNKEINNQIKDKVDWDNISNETKTEQTKKIVD